MCLVAKPALWILQRQNPILGCLNYRQCLSMFAVFDSQSRILEVGQTATSNPIVSQVLDLREKNTGWWYTYPFEKYEFVSWGYYSQYMEKMLQTTTQEKKHHTFSLLQPTFSVTKITKSLASLKSRWDEASTMFRTWKRLMALSWS